MIKFEGVPLEMSVRCISGCGQRLQGKNQTVRRFPPVPMRDVNGRAITLTFQHMDYQDLTITKTVYPGPNTIHAKISLRGK
ncbi:MAG: hypothetical protein JKY37_20155 [Nannocystaceae bacterium]|nr:hypothetical protein [Nannocystaceae bacterium]